MCINRTKVRLSHISLRTTSSSKGCVPRFWLAWVNRNAFQQAQFIHCSSGVEDRTRETLFWWRSSTEISPCYVLIGYNLRAQIESPPLDSYLTRKPCLLYHLLSDWVLSFFSSSRTSSCSMWNTFPRLCILTIGNPFWSVQTFINSFTLIFPFAFGKRQKFSETKCKPIF